MVIHVHFHRPAEFRYVHRFAPVVIRGFKRIEPPQDREVDLINLNEYSIGSIAGHDQRVIRAGEHLIWNLDELQEFRAATFEEERVVLLALLQRAINGD